MRLFKKFFLLMFAALTVFSVAACQYESNTIYIAEGDWDSNRFYNDVVEFILENGYGEDVEITEIGTQGMVLGLTDGSIDLNVETWSENMATYQSDIAAGYYEELGVNFDDNYQGLYIPQYIKDANPGLVSVDDLVNYKSLFPDPEVTGWNPDTDKAVVYGGPSSWSITEFFKKKFENSDVYPDLVANFEFRPLESTATLNTTIVSAFNNQSAWVGYYWEPTDIMGLYDMYLLEDNHDYNVDTGVGFVPTNNVTIVATAGFKDVHPDAATFLSKMHTSSSVVNAVLAYMVENDLETYDAAVWWLDNNEDMWSQWVTADAQTKIREALDAL